MSISKIIKNPFFAIGVALVVVLIYLFITLRNQSKQPITPSCKDGLQLCGTECKDPATGHCLIDNTWCDKGDYCGGDVCCKKSDKKACDVNGQCKDCPIPCEGTNCCQTDETCLSGTCCKSDKVVGSICCNEDTGEVCGDNCCLWNQGQVCGPDKKCIQGCPSNQSELAKNNPDLYNSIYGCNGTVLNPAKQIACKQGEICDVDCSTTDPEKRYICSDANKCSWNEIPIPGVLEVNNSAGQPKPLLVDNDGNPSKQGTQIYQCKDDEKNYWIKYNNSGLKGKLYATSDSSNCHATDCFNFMNQQVKDGVSKFNQISVSNQAPTEFKLLTATDTPTQSYCTTTLNCDKILLGENDTTKLTNICNGLDKRCCKAEDGSYTGKVCGIGQYCDTNGQCKVNQFYYDSSQRKCLPIPADYKGQSYDSYTDCLDQTSICPKDKSLDCITDMSCICCGNWVRDNGSACNEPYKLSGQWILDNFKVNGANWWSTVVYNTTDYGTKENIYTIRQMVYIQVPSDVTVSISEFSGPGIKLYPVQGPIKLDNSDLSFNLYPVALNLTPSQAPRDTTNIIIINLTTPTGQTFSCSAWFKFSFGDNIDESWVQTQTDHIIEQQATYDVVLSDSNDFSIINGCLMTAEAKNGPNPHANFLFLNFPLAKSSEAYNLTETKSPIKRKHRPFLLAILIVILLLLVILFLSKTKI